MQLRRKERRGFSFLASGCFELVKWGGKCPPGVSYIRRSGSRLPSVVEVPNSLLVESKPFLGLPSN